MAFLDWFDRWQEQRRAARAAELFNHAVNDYELRHTEQAAEAASEVTEPVALDDGETPPAPPTEATSEAEAMDARLEKVENHFTTRRAKGEPRRSHRNAIAGPIVVEHEPVRTTVETSVRASVDADPELVAVYKAAPTAEQDDARAWIMRRFNSGERPATPSGVLECYLAARTDEQTALRKYLVTT